MRLYQIILLIALSACAVPDNKHEEDTGRTEVDGFTFQETELDQSYAPLYMEAADLLANQQYDEAEKIYLRLIDLEEEADMAYAGLGGLKLAQNKVYEAIECYQNVLSIKPDNFFGHLGLGSGYYRLQLYETSVFHYTEARNLSPEVADSYWGLAIAYDGLGVSDSAAIFAETFLEMAPNTAMRPFIEDIIQRNR